MKDIKRGIPDSEILPMKIITKDARKEIPDIIRIIFPNLWFIMLNSYIGQQ